MLLEKHAEEMVSLGVNEIIFSLDGTREIHDKIRGAEGIFDKAFKGLQAINTWKEKKKCRTPLINISSTIFETNYLHADLFGKHCLILMWNNYSTASTT